MKSKSDKIPFTMHPRVFSALGADLVTNDIVAVIELVKNAYDALATRVDVRFGLHPEHGQYLEIQDDGHGMDRATIENVWCVVATPYRLEHSTVEKGKRRRRTSGAKGLGRLSAARLGTKLDVVTRSKGQPCWQLVVDWDEVTSQARFDGCGVEIREISGDEALENTGVRIRIYGLKSEWEENAFSDLEENLGRLLSPFSRDDDFQIFLTSPVEADSEPIRVDVPEFLSKPKYAIRGHADEDGCVHSKYTFSPMVNGKPREASLSLTWREIRTESPNPSRLNERRPGCGAFDFEIRAWDIGSVDTQEIADRFEVEKNSVREAIRVNKGISVYRDGILVLPKSEDTRDWLGLDLRRISKTGVRLGTSQIVGYVSITADDNPAVDDTSDREGLVNNPEVMAFREILLAVVGQLAQERYRDRMAPTEKVEMVSLFGELSGEEVVSEIEGMAREKKSASDTLPLIRRFSEKLESVRSSIEKRFIYYSRLATIGTIAQMLVHEIRNRTTLLGAAVRHLAKFIGDSADERTTTKIQQAENAIETLERLADTFAPLASRSFRRRKRDSILEERIRKCLEMTEKDLANQRIRVDYPEKGITRVAVDPGEVDAILLNLITNALFWVSRKEKNRVLRIEVNQLKGMHRAEVVVHDSGPGVHPDDAERIFLPGVTKKPGGIGMGLTVASELVSEYDGKMALIQPGQIGGATFRFDLPLKD